MAHRLHTEWLTLLVRHVVSSLEIERTDSATAGGNFRQKKATLTGSLPEPALICFAGYSANQRSPSSSSLTTTASAISQKDCTHITELTNYFTFSPIFLALSRGRKWTIPFPRTVDWLPSFSLLYEELSATSSAKLSRSQKQ